jgi:D-sedoheptulose 7-phosphate isomerase
MDMRSFIEQYLAETAEMARASNADDLARVIEILFASRAEGRQVYTCGNGGSAANASHFACDLASYASGKSRRRFRCTSLNDSVALNSALTNDLGFERVFVDQLEGRMQAGDVLVCLSVHGGAGRAEAAPWSQNLVAAASYARQIGARVVSFVGYDGGPLRALSDACVVVPRTGAGHTSTPHVEGFHQVYCHLVAERLRQLVEEQP